MEMLGISFEDWYKNEWNHEDSCEIPNCHEPFVDKHELVPGNYRRKYCIEKGYQIKLCRVHHAKAHGIYEKFNERMDQNQYNVFVQFCKIKKLDPEKVMREVMGVEEPKDEEIIF